MGNLYTNPAALATMPNNMIANLSFNNKFGIPGWKEDQIAMVFRPWGRFRTGFMRVNNITEIYEEAGANLWKDARTIFSLGMSLSDRLTIGLKYQRLIYFLDVEHQIKSQNHNLMNIGLLYAGERFSWGTAIHDLEFFAKDKQVLPDFHFGFELTHGMIDYKLELRNYNTAFSNLRDWSISTAAEMEFAPGFVLRIGSADLGKKSNLAIGFGVSLKNISIDYAYTAPYHIKASHHLSTSYYF